jgi:hypothetical protein
MLAGKDRSGRYPNGEGIVWEVFDWIYNLPYSLSLDFRRKSISVWVLVVFGLTCGKLALPSWDCCAGMHDFGLVLD